MRASIGILVVASALATTACSNGSSTVPTAPSSPTAQSAPGATIPGVVGTWLGTATDTVAAGQIGTALGISMGTRMGPGMMGSVGAMPWQITQTGNACTGTVGFGGFQCAARMTMTGTFTGNGGTFTITMPGNSMPMSTCSGTATGTFTIDPVTGQMRGTYSGTNTCMGPFSGQLILVKG